MSTSLKDNLKSRGYELLENDFGDIIFQYPKMSYRDYIEVSEKIVCIIGMIIDLR